jgi:hypothetical protein
LRNIKLIDPSFLDQIQEESERLFNEWLLRTS